jgi:WD40 repeat protein
MSSESLLAVDLECCRRFERAWGEGQPRPIEDCLPPAEDPLFLATLEELVVIDMDFRARQQSAGSVPRLEDYLERFPVLREPALFRRLLREEIRARRRWGKTPAVAEYKDRFPGITLTDNFLEPTVPTTSGGATAPVIAGYEILEEVGRGGMGVVYRARQLALNRVVALKIIQGSGLISPDLLTRFRAEAEVVGRLNHPGIVQVFEVGEWHTPDAGTLPFIALEFVTGGSLAQALTRSPQPAAACARLVETLAQAVHHAHQRGIVHRDLKPSNVLLTADGQPKVTDFGLAKKLDAVGHTHTGAVLGTPSYMAPEQASPRQGSIGVATDVYALGVILYEMLTGRPPFQADNLHDLLGQICSADPVPPTRLVPRCPRDLETICLRCLQKDPARRYATARDLADDLNRFLEGRPIAARPVSRLERLAKWVRRRPVLATLALALFLAVVGLVAASIGFTLSLRAALDEKEIQRQKATDLARTEGEARKDEAAARRVADEKKRLAFLSEYSLRLRLAERDWQENNLRSARRFLDGCLPELRHWEHGYLRRLCDGGLFTWRDQREPILCLAYSPDGERLAAVSGRTVKVREARTGRELFTLESKTTTSAFRAVVITPDGQHLLATDGKSVLKYEAGTGREIQVIPLHEPPATAGRVAFSPDGQRVAVDRFALPRSLGVQVYDATNGQALQLLKGHTNWIASLAFCVTETEPGKKRTLLATAGEDRTVKIRDADTGQELQTLAGLDARIDRLAFSPDGTYLGGATQDGRVRIWESATGREGIVLRGKAEDIVALTFSSHGQLATGGRTGLVRLWNLRTGQEVLSLRGHTNPIQSLAFSPDGLRLASGDLGSEDLGAFTVVGAAVKVWDLVSGPLATSFKGDMNGFGLAFSPDGELLAAGCGPERINLFGRLAPGQPGVVNVWDARTTQLRRAFKKQANVITDVAFSADGRLLASASLDGTIVVWSLDTPEMFTLPGHPGGVLRLAFHPRQQRLASTGFDRAVRIWDLTTRQEKVSVSFDPDLIRSVAFSSDGLYLVAGGGVNAIGGLGLKTPGLLRILDSESGEERHRLVGHTGIVRAVAVSPDGRWVASASEDMSVKLWDPATGKELGTLNGHTRWVTSLVFSPDSGRLFTTAVGGTTNLMSEGKVWDPVTGQEIYALFRDNGPWTPGRLAFTPVGQRLVCVGPGEVRFWESQVGQ